MEVVQLIKNNLIKYLLILSILFILLAVILFDQTSFWFLGIGISIIGTIILYTINH